MKIWETLKELGLTDEQLKDFFKAQRRYKYRLEDIKQHKYDLGIDKYVPYYTPTSLLNRAVQQSKYGEIDLRETVENITKAQEKEKQSLKRPWEIEESLRETLNLANTFRFFPTSDDTIESILTRYDGSYKRLLDDLEDVQDTLSRYQDAPESGYEYYPALQEALTILSAIVYG